MKSKYHENHLVERADKFFLPGKPRARKRPVIARILEWENDQLRKRLEILKAKLQID